MTLLVLLVDNVGTLLVPTMLANMVNTGITTGDVDYILRNGLYMFIATSMAKRRHGAGLLSFGAPGRQRGLRYPTMPCTTNRSSSRPAILSALAPDR